MPYNPQLGNLQLEIQELYESRRRLVDSSPLALNYMLDGLRVGDLGKCYAVLAYALRRSEGNVGHDFETLKPPHRLVQVHTTQNNGDREDVYVGTGNGNFHLLVFGLSPAGFVELYNGPRIFGRRYVRMATLVAEGRAVTASNRLPAVAEVPIYCTRLRLPMGHF